MKRYSLKGNKIYFDEFFYLDLNKQTILDFNLRNRDELTQEEYFQLIKLRSESMGYFLLSKRDYSEKELYLKLLSKYREKSIVRSVIDKFVELGYIDDYDYAEHYISSHSYGRKKMEFMLIQKGVSREIIDTIFFTSQREKDMEEIRRVWLKLGNKERDKKIASLLRKGFEYRDIKKVMNELEN
ncbi:RecX family transcriptional regulator [Fusobacterium sp.]|uniref:regulatory protein RecX n=1 Tax=Fusobacterium sp. TaxID=68766 RepID=UPI0025C5DECF|nr:RecX family transcriptional regulator [Fusobacterium sp.]